MKLPVYTVDAFTSRPFSGNPAAICPVTGWLPDATLQAIAAEHSLPETAFYKPGEQGSGYYDLRWFTPEIEMDLCGHATLASAFVLMELRREFLGPVVTFHTKSGALLVTKDVQKDGDIYALDFPARPPQPLPDPASAITQLSAALGANPTSVLAARDYFCVFESEQQVLQLKPDMAKVAALDKSAVIVTAPGTDCDFVSRFFAPAKGIPEDPVTGSAHCSLIPYWSERLGKTSMFARQRSKRGGELWCEHRGDRVTMAGHAIKFSEGVIELDLA